MKEKETEKGMAIDKEMEMEKERYIWIAGAGVYWLIAMSPRSGSNYNPSQPDNLSLPIHATHSIHPSNSPPPSSNSQPPEGCSFICIDCVAWYNRGPLDVQQHQYNPRLKLRRRTYLCRYQIGANRQYSTPFYSAQ